MPSASLLVHGSVENNHISNIRSLGMLYYVIIGIMQFKYVVGRSQALYPILNNGNHMLTVGKGADETFTVALVQRFRETA